MLANVFSKTTRDRQAAVLIGTFAIALMFLAGMAAYRTVDVSFYYDLPAAYLELMGIPVGGDAAALAFGAIFNTIGALTLAGLAVSMGSASIAGEESDGTIGLLLGNPLSRSKLLVSKAASITLLSGVAAAILWGAGYLVPGMLNVNMTGLSVEALVVHILFNTIFYGFLAMAIGAWTGNGSLASGLSAATIVLGWVAVGMLPLIEGVAWLARAFPWYYFSGSQPILNGANWWHIFTLVTASLVLFAVAYVGVNRRDLKSKSVSRTLIDRLRANPRTAKVAERIAGSARVSGLFAKTASDHQGLTVSVAAIMFYMGIIFGIFWALLPDGIFDALKGFPDALIAMIGGADMSTAAGWFQGEMFSLSAPIAIFAVTITLGAKAIAGEEHRGTMELLMASPISRRRIVMQKAATMVVLAVIVGVAAFAGSWAGALLGNADIGAVELGAASLMLTLLGLMVGGVAMALSAATGSVRIAAYGAVGVALVSYFVFAFLPLSDSLAGWAKLSPFYYYLGGDPLVDGVTWLHAGVLAALFAGLIAVSIPLFERRDLRG